MKKKKKIGQILLEYELITEEMLNEALEHQKKFGGGLTQYLLAFGYMTEDDLAQCVSWQFNVAYIPIRTYSIRDETVKLVPVDIAKEYWLIPLDKLGDVVTIVMFDPLNTQAIKKVEKASGCKVQPFIGVLSDIIEAIEQYYNIHIDDEELKKKGYLRKIRKEEGLGFDI